jgi:hypothetical protein
MAGLGHPRLAHVSIKRRGCPRRRRAKRRRSSNGYARAPVDAAGIAANFRKTRTLEETISNVLESLYRLGHVSIKDGKTFEIRRAA